MAYRQNDALINSGSQPNEYVFRLADCQDIRNGLKKRVIKPTRSERKDTHTEISGFFCGVWPLGTQHHCIPGDLDRREGLLAFERIRATNAEIECEDDGDGYANHVGIRLPRYLDENGETPAEYEIKRDALLGMLEVLWTDCNPPIAIP